MLSSEVVYAGVNVTPETRFFVDKALMDARVLAKHEGRDRYPISALQEGDSMNLYHATYKPRLKSILTKGLITNPRKRNWEDSVDVIYLSDDPFVAESYAESSELVPEEYLDNIIILEIDSNFLDPSLLNIDENNQAGDTFQYSENIPPEAISVFGD